LAIKPHTVKSHFGYSQKLALGRALPSSKVDVVVVGGGVIGASVAYYLACRKVQVTLLEGGDMASGSSGACDGLVLLQSKKPGIHLRLAMESRKLFDRLTEQLPIPIEYHSRGGMVVIETEEELQAMGRHVQEQREVGLDVTLLDIAAARKIEPELSEALVGAAFSPMDGQVNPIALTHAFALGAKRMGARILTHVQVCGLHREGRRVLRVDTDKGSFSPGLVVNAAGVYAPRIGDMAGIPIPIRPRRGQLLVTCSTRPIIHVCMISARYIAAKHNPELAKGKGEGIAIEQTDNGNVLPGSTREFVGFDRRTTVEGLRGIARRTLSVLPGLSHLYVIRSFAGLRPYTLDGLPILGPVAGVEGFIMAAGHEGDGIALSPITGELIAQYIVDGQTEIPMEPFRLERFGASLYPDEPK
jgi:glycine/D-amino acid oxidase-like deaminating enzyme